MSKRGREQLSQRYRPPYSPVDGKFQPVPIIRFKGKLYPSTFRFTVDDDTKLKDGQVIGYEISDDGTLYWINGGVVAKWE